MQSDASSPDARENLEKVYIYINRTAKQTGNWLRIHRHRILQAFVLFLRFGQVATVGLVSFIYFYIVNEHRSHDCAQNPYYSGCWVGKSRLDHVPFPYILMLTAVSFYFFYF